MALGGRLSYSVGKFAHAIQDSYNVLDYGALGNGVADDSAAIQAAINAAATAGGGRVYLPRGTYLLTTSLVLKRGVTIQGVYPGTTSSTGASWDLGFTVSTGTILTFPGGTVFRQDTSAGTGTIAAVDGVVIERLGFNNVGSILTCGATNTSGLSGSVIRDLLASTVTGVAFDLTNPMHLHVAMVKIANVSQLLRITSDYDSTVVNNQPGNSRFDDLYAYVTAAGHALPTVHLRALNTNTHGTPLNYCHFTRLQVNRFASANLTGNHLLLEGSAVGATVNGCTFSGLDLEGYASYRMQLSYTNKTALAFAGNAITGHATADFYARNSTYNLLDSPDNNFVLDMDDSAHPLLLTGVLHNRTGGNKYPLGVWQDGSKGGVGAQLAVSKDSVVDISASPVWTMPEAYLDLSASGGEVRQRRTAWNSASTLTLTKSLLGYVELTFSGATAVTLPDATTCPRQEVTFKQLAAAQTCTISTQLSQTIDGASTNTWLDTQYKYLTLVSNGATWLVVAKG